MAEKPGKKYGLILKKKTSSVQLKPSIFGGDDSDKEEDAGRNTVNVKIRKEAEKKRQIKQTQVEINKVLEEDPTAYDYDAVYDKMAERKANLLAAKTAKADKKPKYISNLLKFAEVRKKEEERRIERQVQKEREAEGSEYADKDAFVTSAYRRKMQEMAEEEERQRRQDERDGDVTKQTDLTKFYRNLLDKNVSTGGSYDTNIDKDETKTSPESSSFVGDKRETGDKGMTRQSSHWGKETRFEKDRGRKGCEKAREESSKHETPVHAEEKHDDEHDKARHEISRREHKKGERETSKHAEQEHEEDMVEHEKPKLKPENEEKRRKRPSDETSLGKDTESFENRESTKVSEKGSEEKRLNKFAKHSSGETVMSARERYLARKKSRVVVDQTGSDDEN